MLWIELTLKSGLDFESAAVPGHQVRCCFREVTDLNLRIGTKEMKLKLSQKQVCLLSFSDLQHLLLRHVFNVIQGKKLEFTLHLFCFLSCLCCCWYWYSPQTSLSTDSKYILKILKVNIVPWRLICSSVLQSWQNDSVFRYFPPHFNTVTNCCSLFLNRKQPNSWDWEVCQIMG